MIKVIRDKIVVRPDKSEVEKRAEAQGISLPEKHNEKSSSGTVLFVGPGRWENGERLPMQILEGDTVYYSRTFAQPIKINGEDLVVVEEKDVLLAESE